MTDKPETAEQADDDRVVVRRISREALYRMRPDLRPANTNEAAAECRKIKSTAGNKRT